MAQERKIGNSDKSPTAVEWLVKKLEESGIPLMKDELEMIQQAKQMEKEQIMRAVNIGFEEGCKHPEDIKLHNAEQYYNETFGK